MEKEEFKIGALIYFLDNKALHYGEIISNPDKYEKFYVRWDCCNKVRDCYLDDLYWWTKTTEEELILLKLEGKFET